MLAIEYKKLKAMGLVNLVYQNDKIEYQRKQFDSVTGEEKPELRVDIVSIDYLQAQRAALIAQIADIDEMILDLTAELEKQADELKSLPEAPK